MKKCLIHPGALRTRFVLWTEGLSSQGTHFRHTLPWTRPQLHRPSRSSRPHRTSLSTCIKRRLHPISLFSRERVDLARHTLGPQSRGTLINMVVIPSQVLPLRKSIYRYNQITTRFVAYTRTTLPNHAGPTKAACTSTRTSRALSRTRSVPRMYRAFLHQLQ